MGDWPGGSGPLRSMAQIESDALLDMVGSCEKVIFRLLSQLVHAVSAAH